MAKRRDGVRLWLLSFAADFAAIAAAYYTTVFVRCDGGWGGQFFASVNKFFHFRESGLLGPVLEEFYISNAPRIICLLAGILCVLYALGDMYAGRRFIVKRPLLRSVVVANITALAMFFVYFYLSRNVFHPRGFFLVLTVLVVIYELVFRAAMESLLDGLRRGRGFDVVRTLLVGVGSEMAQLSAYIEMCHPHGVSITKQLNISEWQSFDELLQQIDDTVTKSAIGMIILADKDMKVSRVMEVVEFADKLGVPLKVLSREMSVIRDEAGIAVDSIHGIPLVHFDVISPDGCLRTLGRVVQLICAIVMCVMILPVVIVIVIAIKLSSRGPVFFLQERIGINRKPFVMYKFRTMYDKADEMQAQLEEFNESGEGLFKIRNDPRITPVGKFLRRFSLDELPQLLNVIKGEMSLVGPRPLPRRDFENYYEEWHYSRHGGLPGLTCLWQVSGRSNLDFHNMCILDVYYLHNRNWILDLMIILRTFQVVLFAKGAC